MAIRFPFVAPRSRLGRRLLWLILLCSTFFALWSTGSQLYLEYNRDLSTLQAGLDQIGESYINSLANSVWYMDDDAINLQLNGILQLPYMAHVAVHTENGQTYQAGTPPSEDRTRRRQYTLHEPREPHRALATLTVTAVLSEIYDRLWGRLLVVFITQSLKTLAVSLAILLIIYLVVTRRLKGLSRRALEFKLGDDRTSSFFSSKSQRIWKTDDEIDDVATALDTMRRSLATEIAQREEESRNRLELERTLRRVERLGAIGQLTSGIVHDLNNYLMTISARADLAASEKMDDVRAEHMDILQQACAAVGRLTSQLLTYARGSEVGRSPSAPGACVSEAVQLVRSGWPKSIGLTWTSNDNLPMISVVPIQLQQVIMNLVLNARDAVEATGTVAVEAAEQGIDGAICTACGRSFSGRFIEILVRDNGAGIAEHHLGKIFDAFYSTKGDNNVVSGMGMGLGLNQVHGIVHTHEGHIIVQSQPGEGTTFRTFWPVPRVEEGAVQ